MITVVLNKQVTTLEDVGGGRTRIATLHHKDLAAYLSGHDVIIADYAFGQVKRRNEQLTALGYTMKEVVWQNDSALHDRWREVWTRGGGSSNGS